MAEIAWLLQNFRTSDNIKRESLIDTKLYDTILKTSFINIKKSDGKKSSENESLAEYWTSDHDLIIKQISILKPDFIVIGGIFHIVSERLALVPVSSGEEYFYLSKILPGPVFINYWHPAYQVPADMYFYTLAYQLNRLK